MSSRSHRGSSPRAWRRSPREGLDRYDGARARAGVPAADRHPARPRGRGGDHGARLRADARAARAPRTRGGRGRWEARRAVASPEGAADDAPARRAPEVGPRARFRRRARPRLARADDLRAPARNPELDDLRLRVRDAATPDGLPRGDAGRGAGSHPSGPPAAVRRPPAEARAVPGPEGGVLPRGLRARPFAAGAIRRRPGSRARRLAAPARRVALSPALEPALPTNGPAPRPERGRAGLRAAAHGGATGVRARAHAPVGNRPRRRSRRTEPDRAGRSRRLRRRNHEPRGGGPRSPGLHNLRRAARRRRRGTDPRRAAEAAHRPAGARADETQPRVVGAGATRPCRDAAAAPLSPRRLRKAGRTYSSTTGSPTRMTPPTRMSALTPARWASSLM